MGAEFGRCVSKEISRGIYDLSESLDSVAEDVKSTKNYGATVVLAEANELVIEAQIIMVDN